MANSFPEGSSKVGFRSSIISLFFFYPRLQELEEALPELAKSSGITGGGDSFVVDSLDSKFVVGDFYFGPPVLKEIRIITPKIAPLFTSAAYKYPFRFFKSMLCC